jgi:hypothetical protein
MKKAHAILLGVVAVGVVGLLLSPMGLGIIGGDGAGETDAAETGGDGSPEESSDAPTTGSGTDSSSTTEFDDPEDVREANLTEEQLAELDVEFSPEEVFGGYDEENLPGYMEPVDANTELPPSFEDDHVDPVKLRQRTFTEAQDPGFTFNYHLSSSGDESGLLLFSGGIYDATEDQGEYTTVAANDRFERVYFREDNAAMQLRNHIPAEEYEGDGAPKTVKSTQRPSMSQVLNFELLEPFLKSLRYEPVAQYELPNTRVTIAQTALQAEDQSLLVEQIPDAESIDVAGGEMHIDETGALLEYRGTVIYQNKSGEQEALSIRATVEYGNHTDIAPPEWASESLLTSPGVDKQLVLNEDENYLLIQPGGRAFESGTEIEVETIFGTKTFEVDRVGRNEALYVYFEDDELTIGRDEPRTLEPIGSEVLVTVTAPNGDLLIAEEVSNGE